MIPVYQGDVLTAVNLPDEELNEVIQDHLDTAYTGPSTTVAGWRIENYKILRRAAMPDPERYLDAQAKLSSGISEWEEQGQEEMDDYNAERLAVNARFSEE